MNFIFERNVFFFGGMKPHLLGCSYFLDQELTLNNRIVVQEIKSLNSTHWLNHHISSCLLC